MSILKDKYNVITLCGSIRFKNEFMKVQEELTLDGNIVFTPNFFNNLKGEINAIFNATPKKNDKKRRKNIKLAISIDA